MPGTLVAALRKLIYVEGARARGAASEELIQRLASTSNFHALYQFDTKAFFLNGPYGIVAGAQDAVDGLFVFPFNCEIFDVAMFNITAGSGGTTELDVKRATASGGAFTSIFSTTPKIASSAGANAYVRVGGSGTGLTAPILSSSPFQVNQGHAVRLDIVTKQSGSPANCGLLLFFRPR